MTDFVQLPNGLVIPANFAEELAAPDMTEIATIGNGRDITRGFVDGLPLLPPQDKVLRARGGSYEIYEDVLRDDQVASTFQQRRLAVCAREWEVLPGGTRAIDKAAAAFLEEQLDRLRWDSITDKMLYGVYYGYAVAECLWARDGRFVVPEAVKVRKQRRFAFGPDGAPRLLTLRAPTGEALPPRKFWTFSTGADNDDEPYGLGLAHWLYWPVLFKRNGLKFWLIFLEKFGMPTAKGTYPANTGKEERNRLLAALHAIQTDSGLIVPEGMQVELIEAARSGTADYSALLNRMDAAIAKVVVGQTLTSEVSKDGGSRALGSVHMDVRQDLVKADADLVCQSFNLTVARWLTEWNFPGAEPPQVWRQLDDDEDLSARATREKAVFEMGFKPTLKHVEETYGGEWVEVARPPRAPAANAAPGAPAAAEAPAAEFAERDVADLAERQAAALEVATAQVLDGLMEPVRRLVMGASSLTEIRDGLETLYPDLDTLRFSELLREALVAAHLGGRFEGEEGI